MTSIGSLLRVCSHAIIPFFLHPSLSFCIWNNAVIRQRLPPICAAPPPRYGPPIEESNNDFPARQGATNETSSFRDEELRLSDKVQQRQQENQDTVLLKRRLERLIDDIVTAADTSIVPAILTKHVDLILDVSEAGILVDTIDSLVSERRKQYGDEAAERVQDALDIIVSFTEDFVTQTNSLDNQNKQLLGKIITLMADATVARREKEQSLDELFEHERQSFTPGFLRHLEGECERVASAPILSRESTRLLEILRTIQLRVVETLGQDLGEVAQTLGMLLAYETKQERQAILDAAISIQGVSFAQEMDQIVSEAMDGFANVSVGTVDPDLVQRVKEIQDRLAYHLNKQHEGLKP